MVITSETCVFSGAKIYPHRGTILVRADSKALPCLNRKVRVLQSERKKSVNFEWTIDFRRKNKKMKENKKTAKAKKFKAIKMPREFQGLSLDDFNNRKKKRIGGANIAGDKMRKEVEKREMKK